MNNYDLILLYKLNRKHGCFFNIVKALAAEYKIGILMDFGVSRQNHKQGETDKLYFNKLLELGAETVKSKSVCKLFLVPVYKYSSQCYDAVKELIVYDTLVVYQRFTCLSQHLEELTQKLPVKIILAEDVKLLRCCLKEDNKESILGGLEVRPLSFIYSDYPVFGNDLKIDYLVVFPTRMSFQKESMGFIDPLQKKKFIKNINALLNKIDKNCLIAYKLHSVHDGGWPFAGRKMEPVLKLFPNLLLRLINKIVCDLKLDSKFAKMAELSNTIEFIFMSKKYKNFASLTPYHNFPVELFYPNIKKGIISGRSNAVWGALKMGLFVYNCDDNIPGSGYGEFAHLKRNYESFGVAPCHGELEFDSSNFDKVKQENSISLVDFLKTKINVLKAVEGRKE